mgnify:CR=1 FL=1
MVELKLFLMPPLKRSGRVKAFLENTTRRVEIFQKSRLGLDSSLEGRFHIFASKTVRFDRLRDILALLLLFFVSGRLVSIYQGSNTLN